MSFPSYPAYLASGNRWIGEVPAHWCVRSLGSLGPFSASGIDKISVEGQPSTRMVNYTDVYGNSLAELRDGTGWMETTTSPEKIAEHTLRDGDVLFTPSSETSDDIAHAAVYRVEAGPAVFSYHLTRFQPSDELDRDFARYTLNANPLRQQFSVKSRGTTRQILNRADFRSSKIALPSPSEQRAIAAFLDYETAKIDTLVDEQQSLIALLKEKRQAVISHAVTKGLNPDAPMKDSGIEWLGEVPAHWVQSRTSRHFNLGMGQTILSEDLSEEGVPVFSATEGDHYFGYISEPKLRLQAGSLVIPARGNSIGHVKLATEECSATQTTIYASIRDRQEILPAYAYWTMRGLRKWLFPFTQTAIPQITTAEVGANVCLIPPADEQARIADRIAESVDKLDALVTEGRKLSLVLSERRAALISAAVTGKIDVRASIAARAREAA